MEGSAELVTYGPLGIFVVILIAFAKQTIDRLLADRDRAEKQRDDVLQIVLSDVAPALRSAAETVQKVTERDSEIGEVLADVRRLLERNQ